MCFLGKITWDLVNEKSGYKRVGGRHLKENHEHAASLRKSYYQRTLIITLGFSLGHFLFNETTFDN